MQPRVSVAHRGDAGAVNAAEGRFELIRPSPTVPTASARPMAVARTPEALGATPSTRSSWIVEARTLARQTIKEGMKIWLLLAAIVLVPPLLAILFQTYLDASLPGLAGVLVVLVAGASAFGLETRARTNRFLVHHGARPGLVWLVKLSVWVVGAAVIGVLFAGVASMTTIVGPLRDTFLTTYLLTLLVVFGVGDALRDGIPPWNHGAGPRVGAGLGRCRCRC